MTGKLKDWARAIKRDVHAIYLAARDPRVPWYAKALALCVAGYALSPIDLIPDFIPVFGYLDDLIIVPLGILAVVKLIPPEIMAQHRAAAALASERPISHAAAAMIVIIFGLYVLFPLVIIIMNGVAMARHRTNKACALAIITSMLAVMTISRRSRTTSSTARAMVEKNGFATSAMTSPMVSRLTPRLRLDAISFG